MNRRRWIVLSFVVAAASATTVAALEWRRWRALDEPDPAVVEHTPTVRVLLSRDASSFEITVDGPSTIIDDTGKTLATFEAPIKQMTGRLKRGGDGGSVLELGSLTVDSAWVEIRPTHPARFRVAYKEKGDGTIRREYRGSLRCLPDDDGTLKLINRLDVESYLKGVVGMELNTNFPLECFRAQAVAARTFALYQKNTVGRRRPWDVTATAGSQVYAGIAGERRSRWVVDAVDSTRGVVCAAPTPEGDGLLCTFYSAICGGRTMGVGHMSNLENAGPLAGGIACEHCRAATKNYRWSAVSRTKKNIAQSLRRRYDRFKALGPIDRVEVATEDDFGRPIEFRIVGTNGKSETLKSEYFRLTIDLDSPDFQMEDQGDTIAFSDGRGMGHLAGLCQWGASGYAKVGDSAASILRRYYPGVELIRAY